MKLCDNCKKNFATVHLTEIKEGKSNEMHLCEQCAKELKVPHKNPVSVNDLLGVLLEKNVSQTDKGERDLKCPECGISFADFKKKGRCGCANDYTVFKRNLAPVLEKIHGSSKYIGKVPASQDGQPIFLRELLALRQKLKEVIRSEEYEKAARIRDRINELEELATGPSLDTAVEPPDVPGAENPPRDSGDREE